jgi:hypothetical protein
VFPRLIWSHTLIFQDVDFQMETFGISVVFYSLVDPNLPSPNEDLNLPSPNKFQKVWNCVIRQSNL